MGEKALDVYQGSDWITYRWPVAQVFDTLDRVRDLCRHSPEMYSPLPQLPDFSPPRYDIVDEEGLDIFGCIVELCDDLSGELDAAQADLFPHLQPDAAHRWMGFEMRLHLKEMREEALSEHQSPEPSHAATDTILALAARIRDLLKRIDQ